MDRSVQYENHLTESYLRITSVESPLMVHNAGTRQTHSERRKSVRETERQREGEREKESKIEIERKKKRKGRVN